jgi:hypothetical protein
LKILADESVEGEIVARLRSEGHDVAYVPEISAGSFILSRRGCCDGA